MPLSRERLFPLLLHTKPPLDPVKRVCYPGCCSSSPARRTSHLVQPMIDVSRRMMVQVCAASRRPQASTGM